VCVCEREFDWNSRPENNNAVWAIKICGGSQLCEKKKSRRKKRFEKSLVSWVVACR